MMWGLLKSEFYKMIHTPFYLIHLVIPIIGFVLTLCYYSFSTSETLNKVNGYIELLAIAFPLLISIVCASAVDTERSAGNFKEMIGLKTPKYQSFLAKLLMLLIIGGTALGIALFGFVVGFQFVLKQNNLPFSFYVVISCILFGSQIFLYVFHMILSLEFGKGVSMTVGALESLCSALMLTGLGEVIWKFIPCSWGIRFTGYYSLSISDPDYLMSMMGDVQYGIVTATVLTASLLVAAIVWVSNYESKNCIES